MKRAYAPSCENNQAPIFTVLASALAQSRHVLEIGSGTGQHSVYFAPRLPHLLWQTSDLAAHHPSILAWHEAMPSENLRAPLILEIGISPWPQFQPDIAPKIDAVFTSNTLHILSWVKVQTLLALVGNHLPVGGKFVVYGPFNYDGNFTSDSNREFDAWLKARDELSGIRDVESVIESAAAYGMQLIEDHAMPANNRCLVFQKVSL